MRTFAFSFAAGAKRLMYPYLHLGPWHPGTFGLLLWFGAVLAAITLHRTFLRDHVTADALNIVAVVVIAGVLGAKLWHELENPAELAAAMRQIVLPGWSHPGQVVAGFLHWFQAGFAWFGGLVAGIAALCWQGATSRPNGLRGGRAAVRMLDLAAPAACIGYGVGRIGCLLSGDGDYGRNTASTLWGVHMKPDALVPPTPPDALVLPTPLWEFGIALVLAAVLWQLGRRARPLGWLTGVYLMLTGAARFLVEFERINPRLYLGMSNAQVAAMGSVLIGGLVVLAVRNQPALSGAQQTSATPLAEAQP